MAEEEKVMAEPKVFTVELTLLEEMLGTTSGNPKIQEAYVASKILDTKNLKALDITQEEAQKRIDEEVQACEDAVGEVNLTKTIFPKDENGVPFLWDYQIKGFFKDACQMIKKIPGSKSYEMKAYKKEIDGLIFVEPRRIPIIIPEGGAIGDCQRPLRASTPMGERIALANSETVPAGSKIRFKVICLVKKHQYTVLEWLNYGKLRGLGQWRNSGAGRFEYDIIDG